jgi:hypothetical protein
MRKFSAASRSEFGIFKRLSSPQKIQDFLDDMPINFEPEGITLRSPLATLRANKAHCIEGALLAAAALWYHGERPLILDLRTTKKDFDHVVTLFRKGRNWGALSKTNHAVLRYRDPVYRTVRELALSYFNEYFLDSGEKTLRSYSEPFDLSLLDDEWLISEDDLWDLERALDRSPHRDILEARAYHRLRPAHALEIEAGKLTEWKRKNSN